MWQHRSEEEHPDSYAVRSARTLRDSRARPASLSLSLPPWWLVVDDGGGFRLRTLPASPGDSSSQHALLCPQGELQIGRAALDNRAASSRTSRMPCNRCSYGLRHTAFCSYRASQPQLSTLNALAIMLIYRGNSSERGGKHVKQALTPAEVRDVHAASMLFARKRA